MSLIIRNYRAGARVEHRRLAKFSADGIIVHASAATDLIIGVIDCPNGADTGDRVDVVRFGFADVEFAGAVAAGAAFTAAADGKAVVAAPVAGANAYTAGRAEVTVAAGDFYRCLVSPGVVQG